MKHTTLVAILVLAAVAPFAPPTYAGSSAGAAGLIFTISLPKAEFSRPEPIPLTFVVKNASATQQHFPRVCGGVDKKTGKPFVRFGVHLICQRKMDFLQFKGCRILAHEKGTLEPGESHEGFVLDLSECFELVSGIHEVQLMLSAARNSPFPDGASNRLRFTIHEQ